MDNNNQLLKGKLDQLIGNTLQTLETETESQLNDIERIKYDMYDYCVVQFKTISIEEQDTHYIKTCPNPKSPDKKIIKDNNTKKPIKVEEQRTKTPTKAATPVVKPKSKPINTNHKVNDKKSSFKNEDFMSKTVEMKRSPTALPPKKKGLKISITKTPIKTPKASIKKKSNPNSNSISKSIDNDKSTQAKKDLKQAISNITIIPQLIPKYIYIIPNQLKLHNTISMLYILTKTTYLLPIEKYRIIISSPLLFKEGYNSSLSFLIEPKITLIKNQINEIETLFSLYGDIESYLSKTFSPTKTAQNSLTFVTKEEEINLSKREDLPKEIGLLFHLIYVIFEEQFDDNIPINQLITDCLNNILPKYEVKDLSKIIYVIS